MPLVFRGWPDGPVYYSDENSVLHKVGEAHYQGRQVYTSWTPRVVTGTISVTSGWLGTISWARDWAGDTGIINANLAVRITLTVPVTCNYDVWAYIPIRAMIPAGDVIPAGTELRPEDQDDVRTVVNGDRYTFTEVRQ